MEVLYLIGSVFGLAILVILSVLLYEKFHLKFIDKTCYKYYDKFEAGGKEKLPMKFKYKGHDMRVNISIKVFDKDISCYEMNRIIYIINDKPVACLSVMECTFITKRVMCLNTNYDTSEFYQILRAARKEYNKRFKERCKNRYTKLY